jgi:hypothetical protein
MKALPLNRLIYPFFKSQQIIRVSFGFFCQRHRAAVRQLIRAAPLGQERLTMLVGIGALLTVEMALVSDSFLLKLSKGNRRSSFRMCNTFMFQMLTIQSLQRLTHSGDLHDWFSLFVLHHLQNDRRLISLASGKYQIEQNCYQ